MQKQLYLRRSFISWRDDYNKWEEGSQWKPPLKKRISRFEDIFMPQHMGKKYQKSEGEEHRTLAIIALWQS